MADGQRQSKVDLEKYFITARYTVKEDPLLYVKEGSHKVVIKYEGEEDKTFEYDVDFSILEDAEGHVGYLASVEDAKKAEVQGLKKAELESCLAEKEIAASYVHELRNPIFSIRGFLQILRQSFNDDDKRKEYTDIAIKELDRMHNLINDYLSKYKGNKGLDDKGNRGISVKNILEELMAFFQHNFQLKGISYDLEFDDDELLVSIDKEHLIQVFINIIQNSIDAMNRGANLTIKAFKEDNWACVEIKDEGIGIKQDDIDKIFTPFFSTKENGTGLGLYISKRIVDKSGGSIKVESKEGKGTTTFIKFPLAKKLKDAPQIEK